ncbi:MAG: metallophosphoesterase [Candidatus Cryptobacteroides sp.]
MKRLIFLVSALIMAACTSDDTVVIFQVSDTQMGFYARNRDMEYETRTFTEAVEAINAVYPDAVVFTGDLVHDCKDEAQWTEFRRIEGMLDASIRRFYIPGNHDIVAKGRKFDMTPYTEHIGPDRFCDRVGNVLLTGMNTDILKYTEDSPMEEEQINWLRNSLSSKRKGEISIVFGHHPFFLTAPDEPEEYFNIRPEKRETYLGIFRECDVDAVFCGHKHDNYVTADGDIPVVTTSAIGKPLGEAPSGIRVIVCSGGVLRHAYMTPDEIPSSRKELIDKVSAQQ